MRWITKRLRPSATAPPHIVAHQSKSLSTCVLTPTGGGKCLYQHRALKNVLCDICLTGFCIPKSCRLRPTMTKETTCSVCLGFIGVLWSKWIKPNTLNKKSTMSFFETVFVRHNHSMWQLTHLLLEKDVKGQNGQEAEVGWHRRPIGLLSENKQRRSSMTPSSQKTFTVVKECTRCFFYLETERKLMQSVTGLIQLAMCVKSTTQQTRPATLRDVTSLLDSRQHSLPTLISLGSKWRNWSMCHRVKEFPI